ncbi:MAG: DUF885 domain-containing protein [Acidimicrobiia bacterium]|nr:DUF885 domain-containing protein [Acidimicrobiia bacterium]
MPLSQLGDLYWRTLLSSSPLFATQIGERSYDAMLPPPTVEADDQLAAVMAEIIAQAETLDPDELDAEDRISRDVLINEAGKRYSDASERTAEMVPGPLTGPHTTLLRAASQTTVDGPDQAEAIASRYAKIPAYLGVAADRYRKGMKRGLVPAAIVVRHVISQIDAYLATPIEADPFVNTRSLAPWQGEGEWRGELEELVAGEIRPAFARYRDMHADEVLPMAMPDDRPGLTHLDLGPEWYEGFIFYFTSVTLTGDEVHEIGLREAERCWAEFGEIGEAAFGLSDPADVIERLREDPAMRFTSAEEIIERSEDAIRKAEAAVADWFNVFPKAPCVVQPVPADQAPSLPPAFYGVGSEDGTRPGTFFANTYEAEKRDRFSAEAIAFHEAVPGHHFDRTIAQELEGIPAFRRYALAFSHAEGWGLYVERLADEMGLYSSDVDRLGMVSADMWRACRLVIDSGIHALGWTRQQAIDFMREKTPISEEVIAQEVDRYISLPGQALAYMIGKLHIDKLRRQAEAALGDRFDIKGFHDVLLVHGGLPLPVMEELVDDWVAGLS